MLFLSLLSKETGLIFVFISFLYLLFFKPNILKTFGLHLAAYVLIYIYLRFGLAQIFFNKHGLTPMSTISLAERLVNIPAIIYFYLHTFFWPANLAINQQWIVREIGWGQFWRPTIIITGFFVLIFGTFVFIRLRSWRKVYFFFVLWFLAALGLHLQIFPLDLTVSDRWFYLPLAGLLGILGVFIIDFSHSAVHQDIFVLQSFGFAQDHGGDAL